MTSAELKRAKRDVRRRVLAARDAMSGEARERAAALVTERLLKLAEMERASTVMAFWSFGSELDTGPLIEAMHARGVRVALPRIVEGDIEPRDYLPGDAVTVTTFGAMEPAAGAHVDPLTIDVVVTPAVAFDRRADGSATAAASTTGSSRVRAPTRSASVWGSTFSSWIRTCRTGISISAWTPS